ncbi:hypothetical protein F0562_034265 [Nyssa sinensis]|uniref:non-specific serine/threonine protein kinase n=1 Tax=Nyssa sinensis TaxID=561372 RepID=A0A5J5AEZ5_9ASTE|nr:hypothetical protein F0562_034265 [Nyssa sinensis]
MLIRFLGILLLLFSSSSYAIDFLFDSFTSNDLIFTGDARIDASVIRFTIASNQFSMGRAFYPNSVLKTPDNTTIESFSSFSTSFIFSILPEISNSPGFGLAFVISNSTVPVGALSGQYFGLFSNSTVPSVAPLLVIEFDTGQNPEFNDPNGNHVGINLNNIESIVTHEAGYFNSTTEEFIPIDMRSGSLIKAWIEFDGKELGINVTIAPAETQRILAWSLTDQGVARDINTSNLPIFPPESSSSSPSLSPGSIAGIIVVSIAVLILLSSGLFWFWLKKKRGKKDDEEEKIQDWELEYWPHRFSYEELVKATNGFSKDKLLGSGGFGRVYKGTLANNTEVAVKCVSHDSNQGLREFMAEISSIGRLQHKNLIHMRGWCQKGRALMLVYDYMPNGSLYGRIFSKSRSPVGWQVRLRVLMDVAEGLNYLHHGWDHLVLHRDIKSSNILLDSDMRGRLGDFGLAKLYKHGQAPATTRLVGTIGYMAPELVKAGFTAASDVYSFGVVVLEVACGRRPTDMETIDEPLLIDWVRKLFEEGRILEAVDGRIAGEYKVEDMEMVLKLGLACCNLDPHLRPNMKEVVTMLMDIAAIPASSDCLFPEIQLNGIDVAGDISTVSKLSAITDPSPRT